MANNNMIQLTASFILDDVVYIINEALLASCAQLLAAD